MEAIEKRRNESTRGWLVSLFAVSALAFLSTSDGFQLGGMVAKHHRATAATELRVSMTGHQEGGDGADKGKRIAEFMNLEPVQETDARRARLERDQENKDHFAEYGDALWSLRKKMTKLSEKLVGVLAGEDSRESEELIRHELRSAEQRDPELVYEMELLEMELATQEGDAVQARKFRERALSARSCLPHFNLEGLWVGKYVHNISIRGSCGLDGFCRHWWDKL